MMTVISELPLTCAACVRITTTCCVITQKAAVLMVFHISAPQTSPHRSEKVRSLVRMWHQTCKLIINNFFFFILYIFRATTLHIQNSTLICCKILLFVDRCVANTRHWIFDSKIYFIWRQTKRCIFGRNNYLEQNDFILYCNCILTITLILRIVTFNHDKIILISIGISNIQVETQLYLSKEAPWWWPSINKSILQ